MLTERGPALAELRPPTPAEAEGLAALAAGLLPPGAAEPKLLRQLAQLCHMLLPGAPPDAAAVALLQALWVYQTDAVVDGAPDPEAAARRLRRWLEPGAPDPGDPAHQTLAALRAEVGRRAAAPGAARWWAAAAAFVEAQVAQRARPAASYLAYLEERTVAQAVPLTIELAALLLGRTEELAGARAARLLWWAGCYIALMNDDSSYEREVAEGVAASANARGVLGGILARAGVPGEGASALLVRCDIDGALAQLRRELGPREMWSATDGVVARLAALLEQRFAH